MTKRFKLRLSKLGNGMITDTQKREDLYFDKEFLDATLPKTTQWLNTLAEENEQYEKDIGLLIKEYRELRKEYQDLHEENEQLRELLEEGLGVSQVEIDEELERMNKNE